MFSQATSGHLKIVRIFLLFSLVLNFVQPMALASQEKPTPRAIISDDFTENRPKSLKKRTRNSRKRARTYRLATTSLIGTFADYSLQAGVTLWRLEYAPVSLSPWIARRVESDTEFRAGEFLRLSIESPHPGYLYVVNRDWFTDGTSGETNLIFPLLGEDNRVQAGKLIDIPAPDVNPFKTTPKSNQAGELLTIIITSKPLRLPISEGPLPISDAQLYAWEQRWGGPTARYEMNGGAGEVRTRQELQAAERSRARQLTRDDPSPQTIYFSGATQHRRPALQPHAFIRAVMYRQKTTSLRKPPIGQR